MDDLKGAELVRTMTGVTRLSLSVRTLISPRASICRPVNGRDSHTSAQLKCLTKWNIEDIVFEARHNQKITQVLQPQQNLVRLAHNNAGPTGMGISLPSLSGVSTTSWGVHVYVEMADQGFSFYFSSRWVRLFWCTVLLLDYRSGARGRKNGMDSKPEVTQIDRIWPNSNCQPQCQQ